MENQNIGSSLLILLIVGLVVFVAYKILSMFKFPKIGAMTLISGGVKTGKTTFGVALALREYKKAVRSYRIKKYLADLFGRKCPEEPLLYSNIPLNVPYVPITRDLLLRKTRFAFGSIIYVCEASLVCDSQMIKQDDTNNRLLLFNKLIGHSTHGGKLIYDTQQIADVHYAVKRSLSEYFYIHHLVKCLPFFLIAYVREERYSDDGTIVNTYDGDIEDKDKKFLTRVIIPKSTWKKFDCYCYSYQTDDLPVENCLVKTKDLKARNLVSFRKWDKYITKNKEDIDDGNQCSDNKEEENEEECKA